MADSNSTQGRIINGFYPASVTDIDCLREQVMKAGFALEAL